MFSFSQNETQKSKLEKLSNLYATKEKKAAIDLQQIAKQKGWDSALKSSNSNQIILLTGIDSKGLPIYTATDNNTTSAATTHTNYLWQNPFNLTGSSLNMKGKMAIWDGGAANNNHIELSGRIIVKDFANNVNHSTHVAGTLIASGINPASKGMASKVEQLNSYSFKDHISEIAGAASNLLISNHSYGIIAGWQYSGAGNWQYWGNSTDSADYKFGIYDEETQMLDSIAYNAPYYLIVKSSGNNRNQNGPTIGQPYQIQDDNGNWIDAGNRKIGTISSNDAYDIIPSYGVAKNVLTIGAVEGITTSSTKSANIKMSSFSSWGPTDDGRIKPDLVGAGVNDYSCISDGIDKYETYSGTSMATPNVTGSLFLLQELYSKKNSGSFMKASTLKALAIHTTSEAGEDDGPDYKFGWGLLNIEKAANIINAGNNNTSKIVESTLNTNDTFKLNVIASGAGKLMATIVWTDIIGKVTTINLLNNPALKLINDLDIRIIKGSTIYMPWVLNPAIPSLAATKGDNFRDNVERIEVEDFIPGQEYTVQITHKGVLQRGSQSFSLILSGIGGSMYCNPYTINNNVVKVDSFILSNINVASVVCNNYNDNTNSVAYVEPSKSYQLNITLSNCNPVTNNKIAKLFIDYNHNGSFNDATDLVYESTLVAGISSISTNITIPNNITIGTTTLMRLVVIESNNPIVFNACSGSTNAGTTQDYLVRFINPIKDIAVNEIELPTTTNCSNNKQLVSVRITNAGDSAISNIPLTAIIKNGGMTIANLIGNYSASLMSGESVVYTFQTPFTSSAATTYNITATASILSDQNLLNNSTTIDITTTAAQPIATGQANICGTNTTLRAFNTNNNQHYFWYDTNNETTPIASGVNTTTSTISSTYYLGAGISTNIGAISKASFNDGDYQAKGGNYFKYTSSVPMLLESAKIYTAYSGKVTITIADIRATFPNGSYTYNTLNTTTINVVASRPIQARGDITGNDIADTGFYYNINLLLPSGNHAIIITTDSVANIFRNKGIASNPYPYKISNAFSITGNNAATPETFYYYLYNMQLRTLDCKSDKTIVIPTIAALPMITKIGDSLVANAGIYYQWLKDGVEIVGETNQTYKPILTANYSCNVTDNSGCTQLSNIINTSNSNYNSLKIATNPISNLLKISYPSAATTTTYITIIDAIGKVYLQQSFNDIAGISFKQINATALANGIYIVTVKNGNKVYTEKFVVIK